MSETLPTPCAPAALALLTLASGAGAQGLAFTERTLAAGLETTHACAPVAEGLCELTGGGAVGDFDRDGWMDLFVVGGGVRPDRLFMNDGDGTFTERSTEWGVAIVHLGVGAAVGDFDGDGWHDIYVTSLGTPAGLMPGQHRLYRNTGRGTFADVAVQAGVNTTSSVVADGFGAAFGDFDVDGDLDLFVAGWNAFFSSDGNRLFRNDGDGTFTDVTDSAISFPQATHGFAPSFRDMDGDGYPELLLAADFGTSRYYINDGRGGFVDATVASGTGLDANGMGSTIADFDGDGLLDWYVTSIYDEDGHGGFVGDGNKLYRNLGDHSYDEIADLAGVDNGAWGWGTVAVDFDHDGDVDLAETNGYPILGYVDPSFLWLNEGRLAFTEVGAAVGFRHIQDGKGLIHWDADRDGDQDLVVLANDGSLQYFRNELPVGEASWLRIRLDTSGRSDLAPDGFGARVLARAGGRELLRVLDGSNNYLTTSEPALHFGLGSARVVDELVVIWPDGTRWTRANVAVNQDFVISAR